MIRVTGSARLKVQYSVDLDMTEAEFDSLSPRNQEEILDEAIDWQEVMNDAETDDIDVDDLEEIDEEESA